MTGREISMEFRVLAALFGHMGIEANPAHFNDKDKAILMRGLEIYKAHRDWMSDGQLLNLSEPGDDPDLQMLVSAHGDQAYWLWGSPPVRIAATHPFGRIRPASHYELVELALQSNGLPLSHSWARSDARRVSA